MRSLTEIANSYALDKGTEIPNDGQVHGPRLNFTPVYEKYFNEIRNEKLNILEIGVETGYSLKMWKEFFVNSQIYGIDIQNKSQFNEDRIQCFQADQSNREQLENIVKDKKFDIIIDDGSHVVSHQQISLGFLFKYLNSNGMYWIEDLHTSDGKVWQNRTLYGNSMSFDPGTSTVDVIKRFINEKVFFSKFLSQEGNDYLNENIKDCELFYLGETVYGFNKLAYFRKK